jgi:hypothetical protein
MFKNAGLMIVTILLLVIPALASAMTLKVKVSGPTGVALNTVAVSGGVTATITGGSHFYYPITDTTVTVAKDPTYTTVIKVDGLVTLNASNSFTAGSHSVEVVYVSPAALGGPVTLTQTTGGTISVQLPNRTWTSTSTNVPQGSSLPIIITAMNNYKIVNYSLNGAPAITTGVTGATGQVLTVSGFVVGATNSITATFAPVASLTDASISAPLSLVMGNSATSKVTATRPVFGNITTTIGYSWTITAKPAASALVNVGATDTFLITPDVIGNYTVQCAVTPQGGVTQNLTRSFTVAAASSVNTLCSSCHFASTKSIMDSYSSSQNLYMNGAVKASCVNCHSSAPHRITCAECHTDSTDSHRFAAAGTAPGPLVVPAVYGAGPVYACSTVFCHGGTGSAHPVPTTQSCIVCHNIAIQHPGNMVKDNDGVRVIVPEFNKRSHHITGAAPTDAQCAVCHLEGKKNVPTETGIPGPGLIVIDTTKHMVDAQIHLRNADTNADMAWNGSNHSVMDNFCFSCHDANGATAIPATFAGVTGFTGTAMNPFGDTLTNGYDQVARAGVVNVESAFNTANASHHAVKGKRYTYRFSTLVNAEEWAARTGNAVPDASEIAEGHVATDINGAAYVNSSPFGTGSTYEPTGPEEGGEATLYEGGKFVSTYIPLGESLSVADNSVMHCGDCHTVGQWKAGSSTNADGTRTSAAIGAHGSANDYLLRNSLGTDAIHNNLTYVCFNCHKAGIENSDIAWAEKVAEGFIADSVAPANGSSLNPLSKYVAAWRPSWKAGWGALHPAVLAGQFTGYNTAHAVSAMHAQCQADSADNVASFSLKTGGGVSSSAGRGVKFNGMSSMRLLGSWEPDKVKVYDYAPAAGATATNPITGEYRTTVGGSITTDITKATAGGSNTTSGNITGISCINCHNSGLRNGWGGIHGGDNTYTDGLGRTQKTYRFMPGMGNYRYAPPGGWDGKDVSDPSLLTVNNPLYPGTPGNRNDQSVGFPGTSGKPMGGCYTNNSNAVNTVNGTSNLVGNDGVTSQTSAIIGAADLSAGQNGQAFSTCNHHGTTTVASVGTLSQLQSQGGAAGAKTANFRTTYGGGTTGNPTTYEPTVREATAGGTLVTRPLKY